MAFWKGLLKLLPWVGGAAAGAAVVAGGVAVAQKRKTAAAALPATSDTSQAPLPESTGVLHDDGASGPTGMPRTQGPSTIEFTPGAGTVTAGVPAAWPDAVLTAAKNPNARGEPSDMRWLAAIVKKLVDGGIVDQASNAIVQHAVLGKNETATELAAKNDLTLAELVDANPEHKSALQRGRLKPGTALRLKPLGVVRAKGKASIARVIDLAAAATAEDDKEVNDKLAAGDPKAFAGRVLIDRVRGALGSTKVPAGISLGALVMLLADLSVPDAGGRANAIVQDVPTVGTSGLAAATSAAVILQAAPPSAELSQAVLGAFGSQSQEELAARTVLAAVALAPLSDGGVDTVLAQVPVDLRPAGVVGAAMGDLGYIAAVQAAKLQNAADTIARGTNT